jgi:hypothetical protein
MWKKVLAAGKRLAQPMRLLDAVPDHGRRRSRKLRRGDAAGKERENHGGSRRIGPKSLQLSADLA